jgi:hypothetical protein
MSLKSNFMILVAVAFLPVGLMASPTVTISIQGKNAEALSLALLNSGFTAEVKGQVRTLNVDSLVMVQGISKHECDDLEYAYCGFTVPANVHTAQQSGQDVPVQEAVQLSDTLKRVVDVVLAANKINNTDSEMGKLFSDYGKISCSWKVLDKTPISISNASCALEVPNTGN